MFDENFSRRNFIKTAALTTFALTAPNVFFGNKHAAAAKACRVKLRQGIYNGFIGKGGIQTWLGIPYAKPPVGKLRWRAPEKLDASTDEFSAKKFGYSPMQAEDPTEDASFMPRSEDCLTLNIWTSGTAEKKPVMFFIPGGGFVSGGSSDPIYNGAKLAEHGVVVVTINYRLNIFGFMNFAAIDPAFEDTGCLGIKDQVAALEWVKENIAKFGGDPDNVTIFGESAGAASVLFLMILPQAKGLFNKAISQSGHLGFYHTFDYSAELARKFMEVGGYKNMRELMEKPAEELLATYIELDELNPYTAESDYFPTCDGNYLPAHPLRSLKDGAARGIKLLTGTTQDEYRYWLLYFPNLVEMMRTFQAEASGSAYESELKDVQSIYQKWRKVHPEFDDWSRDLRYLEFSNQLDWRVGQEIDAEYQSQFDDVYFYLFSQEAVNEELDLRSCHAIDLPFVFGVLNEDFDANPSAELTAQVQAAWTSFAKSGNPNNALIPTWKPYTAADRETMEINAAGWTLHKDLNIVNLDELRAVYEDRLLD